MFINIQPMNDDLVLSKMVRLCLVVLSPFDFTHLKENGYNFIRTVHNRKMSTNQNINHTLGLSQSVPLRRHWDWPIGKVSIAIESHERLKTSLKTQKSKKANQTHEHLNRIFWILINHLVCQNHYQSKKSSHCVYSVTLSPLYISFPAAPKANCQMYWGGVCLQTPALFILMILIGDK